MRVSVITPTGDRSDSLRRQQRYLSRSSVHESAKSLSWIVVDDGAHPVAPPSPRGWDLHYLVRESSAPADGPTLRQNLLTGLQHAMEIESDYVLIWEDDDWYDHWRVTAQIEALERGKEKRIYLHGSCPSIYYHVPLAVYKTMGNLMSASMFETAFSKELFTSICEFLLFSKDGAKGLDTKLWRKFRAFSQLEFARHSLGIKGMPGRAGAGCGHTPNKDWLRDDLSYEALIGFVGEADARELITEGRKK